MEEGHERFLMSFRVIFLMALSSQERVSLITKNTEEVLTKEDLLSRLQNQKKLSAYYGTAPTGLYHMGYLVPLAKLFDFDQAGVHNKVLLADIHAALDDLKTPWDRIDFVSSYYQKCIELSFPWETKPQFLRGSSFQLTKNYQLDLFKLSTLTTVARATRAASEVTRMKNPKVSELVYPLMQALDEHYLDVDIQLGGIDQRHIFAYAREILPQLGYKQRVEVMTPLIVSLKGPGVKMSASIPESRVLVHDSEDVIRDRISKAYCPVGVVQDNPVLQLTRHIVFPLTGAFTIARDKKFGGDVTYKDYQKLESDFTHKSLHPSDLKLALSEQFIHIFKRVRDYFEKHSDVVPQSKQ